MENKLARDVLKIIKKKEIARKKENNVVDDPTKESQNAGRVGIRYDRIREISEFSRYLKVIQTNVRGNVHRPGITTQSGTANTNRLARNTRLSPSGITTTFHCTSPGMKANGQFVSTIMDGKDIDRKSLELDNQTCQSNDYSSKKQKQQANLNLDMIPYLKTNITEENMTCSELFGEIRKIRKSMNDF